MSVPAEGFPIVATDIYPGIAPEIFRDAHKDKVVFSTYLNMVIEPKTRYSQLIAPSAKVTGGGTGLGLAAAKAFARSGARVFLAARRQAPLETAKAEVESIGGEADYAIVDVIDPESVKTGVEAAVKRFGKIDIVVANAGRDADALGRKIAEFDVDDWWSVVESSLKGSFLTAHAALPHLVASKGYLILVSSIGAQLRVSGGSAYNIGKHSLNRLAEWIDIEYHDQGVKSFAVHPGGVLTDLSRRMAAWVPDGDKIWSHTADLSAWTYVRLTTGSEDWLSGRYVDATWSLDELTKLKEKIVEQDALKNRLALPT